MNIDKDLILTKLKECDQVLKSNHSQLSLPIIIRISKKMAQGLKFKPIYVNKNGSIVDGHHRYISSLIVDFELERVSDYPNGVLNDLEWENVEFTEDDWDTASKIRMLNKLDAEHNGMKIEEVQSIIE